jgi:hypothetical protein
VSRASVASALRERNETRDPVFSPSQIDCRRRDVSTSISNATRPAPTTCAGFDSSEEIASNRAIPFATTYFVRAIPRAQTSLQQEDITRA